MSGIHWTLLTAIIQVSCYDTKLFTHRHIASLKLLESIQITKNKFKTLLKMLHVCDRCDKRYQSSVISSS